MAPVLLGVVPFGMVAGIAAASVGLSQTETVGMSVLIYAGAAQLAILDLIGQQAPMAVIILTALIINLRFTIYSASLAPHLKDLPLACKPPLAYLLTDQAYAVAVSAFNRGIETENKPWYYLGAAIAMWITWQTAVVTGAMLGARVPASWQLEFAIPLTFLALLVQTVGDRPSLRAAAAAGGVVLLAGPLPFNLGLVAATLTGTAIGVLTERRSNRAA